MFVIPKRSEGPHPANRSQSNFASLRLCEKNFVICDSLWIAVVLCAPDSAGLCNNSLAPSRQNQLKTKKSPSNEWWGFLKRKPTTPDNYRDYHITAVHYSKKTKNPLFSQRVFLKKGDDILSHITAVPSAQAGLTTLFGMGRGEPRRNNHLKGFCKGVWFWISQQYIILSTHGDKEIYKKKESFLPPFRAEEDVHKLTGY